MPSEEPLLWAWTTDEETWHFADGPAEARNDLLDSADAGWIGQVRRQRLNLSTWLIDITRLLEDAEDRVYDEDLTDPNSNDATFLLMQDQSRDLQNVLTAAVDEWQERNNLVFYAWALDVVHTERIVSDEPF